MVSEDRLKAMSLNNLIRKIERAPDFGYDDEAVELNQRLAKYGKSWKWAGSFLNPSIVIYVTEQGSYDKKQ